MRVCVCSYVCVAVCVWLYVCVSMYVLLAFVPVSMCVGCRDFYKMFNIMLRFPLPLSPRYRPKYWSMECIEMLRKLLLTSGIGIVLAMGDSNCLGEYEL